MADDKQASYHPQTRLIHGRNRSPCWDYSHHVVPSLTRSSAYKLDSVNRGARGFAAFATPGSDEPIYVYDRMGEPNRDLLQEALAMSESSEIALGFASGMSAVHASLMFSLQQGDQIVAHKTLYGCTYSLMKRWLPKYGIDVHFVDMRDLAALKDAIGSKTRLLYLESPSNPNLELLDLPAISTLIRELNNKRDPNFPILSVIDNTFASPFGQRPIEHGIDLVVHSLTKSIGGFGVATGGAIATYKKYEEDLIHFRKDSGSQLAPESAWHVLVYGISTLAMRMREQQLNAHKIAQFMENHSLVERVIFPGLSSFPQRELAERLLRDYDGKFAPGCMVYCVLKGKTPEQSLQRGQLFMDLVAQDSYPITLAVSLGQIRTLIEHPPSMTHCAYSAEEQVKRGIDPGGIRISVGLEQADDLINDLERCLSYLPAL